jgi:AraC-like DNA-binding protein
LRPGETQAKIVVHALASLPLRVAVLIDTAVVPAGERLDFWTESSCAAYVPLQIRSAERGRFWARMWGYELGPLHIYRIAAAANTMIRTSRAVAAGDPECIDLSVIVRGQLNSAQQGRSGVARTGDVISKETSHPAILRADHPFETVVVRVPRELLRGHATHIDSLTAVTISGKTRLAKAAARLLPELAVGLENGTIEPGDESEIVESVVDLIRSLYTAPAGADALRTLRSRAEILLAVESFIEANLGDPDLTPEQIARASFISRRYLHKLFEAEGTSVCGWIRAARLDRCRRDLLDPALAHQTILAIATRWGLPGPQQFSRLFRTTYGCSARELRREARRNGGTVYDGPLRSGARTSPWLRGKRLTALPAPAGDYEAA